MLSCCFTQALAGGYMAVADRTYDARDAGQLPRAEAEMPAEGMTFEMGGRLTENAFVRASISYGGGSGRLSGIRFEEFTRPDS